MLRKQGKTLLTLEPVLGNASVGKWSYLEKRPSTQCCGFFCIYSPGI